MIWADFIAAYRTLRRHNVPVLSALRQARIVADPNKRYIDMSKKP